MPWPQLHGLHLWQVPQQRCKLGDSLHLCSLDSLHLVRLAVPPRAICSAKLRRANFWWQNWLRLLDKLHGQRWLLLYRFEGCNLCRILVVDVQYPRQRNLDGLEGRTLLRHDRVLVHGPRQRLKLDCTVHWPWSLRKARTRNQGQCHLRAASTFLYYVRGDELIFRLPRRRAHDQAT